MSGFSIGGIGSGLDVNSLVAQLVAAERAAPEKRLAQTASRANTQISALGTFRVAAENLQKAVKDLQASPLSVMKASVPGEASFTASATGTAAAGRYDIEVEALAQAHSLRSGAYATAATAVGHGQLEIHLGSRAFSVVIPDGGGSLEQIAAAINQAADNSGVQARVVQADSGAHLVLSSRDTGAANSLRVISSGGDGGLAALDYDPGVSEAMTEVRAASEARIRVDGLLVTRASNQFSDVIPGISLSLTGAQPGTVHTLNVAADLDATVARLDALVTAYNATLGAARQATRYDASTGFAGPLQGDATLRGLSGALRNALTGGGELSTLGFRTATDGTLTLDRGRLRTALEQDAPAVAAALVGTGGMAARIEQTLGGYLGSDGRLQAKRDTLDGRLKDVARQREVLERRMEGVRARYLAQFTALDTLVGQMRSTSDYLAAQLTRLS